MLNLSKAEQAETYLALLRTFSVEDVKRPTSESTKRAAMAELLAYALPMTRVVHSVVNILHKQRMRQDGAHRFWSVDAVLLAEILNSESLARLALRCAGYWRSENEFGESEWSDAGSVGGPRNELHLPDSLYSFHLGKKCAA